MIEEIINYVAKDLMGSPEMPEDVKIKYLIDDEPIPYWWVETGDRCFFIDELTRLSKFVEARDHHILICSKGFWIRPNSMKEDD